jgi:hypothetical protein
MQCRYGNSLDVDFNKLNIGNESKGHKYLRSGGFSLIFVTLTKFSGHVNSFIFAPASNDCLN